MAPIRRNRRAVTPVKLRPAEHVVELNVLEDRIGAGKADPVTSRTTPSRSPGSGA